MMGPSVLKPGWTPQTVVLIRCELSDKRSFDPMITKAISDFGCPCSNVLSSLKIVFMDHELWTINYGHAPWNLAKFWNFVTYASAAETTQWAAVKIILLSTTTHPQYEPSDVIKRHCHGYSPFPATLVPPRIRAEIESFYGLNQKTSAFVRYKSENFLIWFFKKLIWCYWSKEQANWLDYNVLSGFFNL